MRDRHGAVHVPVQWDWVINVNCHSSPNPFFCLKARTTRLTSPWPEQEWVSLNEIDTFGWVNEIGAALLFETGFLDLNQPNQPRRPTSCWVQRRSETTVTIFVMVELTSWKSRLGWKRRIEFRWLQEWKQKRRLRLASKRVENKGEDSGSRASESKYQEINITFSFHKIEWRFKNTLLHVCWYRCIFPP